VTAAADDSDLFRLDATAQAGLIADGEVSAGEAVAHAIGRIERLDPHLQALVDTRFDRARAEAEGQLPDGPFRGVPFLLKDAVQHSEGDRYQHGSTFLRDHPLVSEADTGLTRRFRTAGFVLVGRTKVPELTLSPTTEPLAFGPTHNPWDLTRTPGGSSGGSAAAVAAGLVPVAHGNDMGGSIRIPASCCGLVGLKPSRARTTPAPKGLYWGPLLHEHVLTRSVRDSARVLDAIAGATPGDLYEAPAPGHPWAQDAEQDPVRLRIGITTTGPSGQEVDPECVAAVERTAALLERLGHLVEPFDSTTLVSEAGIGAVGAIISASLARDLGSWEAQLGATADVLEPMIGYAVEAGRAMSAVEYVDHVDALAGWSRQVARTTARHDVVLTPTMPNLPPPLGTISGDQPLEVVWPAWGAMVSFAMPFDASGQPAISLPVHHSAEGLPVGVQLVAAYGREDLLFQLSGQLERAEPWRDRWPALALT
jgi:amidase